jgi:chromosomal replication initiator protein
MDTTIDRAKDAGEVWKTTLSLLKEQVPEPSYRTWLESTRLKEIQGRGPGIATAVVAVPSTFAAEWLQHRYGRIITDALKASLGHPVGLSFAVETRTSDRAIRALDGIVPLGIVPLTQKTGIVDRELPMAAGQSSSAYMGAGRAEPRRSNSQPAGVSPSQGRLIGTASDAARAPVPVLNPRYTFERFLVGRSNQLGASAARRVAEAPGAVYNPLFIYGFRGVGKTHLLQAIGNDAYSRTEARVLCVPAILFDNHAVASRLVTPDALTRTDLLLVDDLHNIAGGSGRAAQRWLAMLIEGLIAAGKGVVVTATQPPGSMLALHDSLRSRLREGMIVALELPDAEMRLRMVGHMAQQESRPVGEGALEVLASSGKTMTQLRGIWEQVVAISGSGAVQEGAEEQTRAVTVQDVQAALATTRPVITLRPRVGPERIIDQVASYFDLETNEMCSSSRERKVMFPRQVAMYLIREQTDRTYEWIAHRFARRDHTTAMHSCARVEELFETNPEVRQMVLELRQMIFGEHEHASSLQMAS